MNFKKEYEGEAKAIITDAFIFTDFKPGELPDMKFFTHVAAWDTGADLDDYSMLIGMDVIRRTDFLITNKDGKTTFQFFASEANKFGCRTPSEGGVEL